MGLLEKIFGDAAAHTADSMKPTVERINELEKDLEQLSDADLTGYTEKLRSRLKEGASLDDIAPEAFAAVREAAKRTLGQRHYDVQLIGGLVLHQGRIAEMGTGEGKTLTSTLPVYLNAIEQKGVHVVTVNDYLAKRDAVWMGQVYHLLGLTVGCVTNQQAFVYDPTYQGTKEQGGDVDAERDATGAFRIEESYLRPAERKEVYAADITYGTNNEFGFDYLRDNLVYEADRMVQRGFNYAIVDEVDSILIDEARTPLIISQPDVEAASLYAEFATITPKLKEGADYNIDEKSKTVALTDDGINSVEKIVGVDNIYEEKGMRYLHYLEQALKAEAIFRKDRDYVVRDGQVVIVDEFTGRMLAGRRYSEGLHQAIEAKEGLQVQPESKTMAQITFQNYFRKYDKLAGMTGTANTSAEEFDKVYSLEVVPIPTHKELVRQDVPDKIYKTKEGKFKAVASEVKKRHEKGQPVLIGTTSIANNEHLSQLLSKEGVPHQMLNAKNHQSEGEIIAQAGKRGAVTCATNMAGRGVDIILGGNPSTKEEAAAIKELGGLFVIGTERHEARRIDNQLRGRAGRQGDPGVTQFFISTEDDLMRIFGGDRVKGLMERLNFPDDEPLEMKMLTKTLEDAQSKVEGNNFDIRKHLLDFDEVLNKHREAVYGKRRTFLEGTDVQKEITEMYDEQISGLLDMHCQGPHPEAWNIEEVLEGVRTTVPVSREQAAKLRELAGENRAPDVVQERICSFLTEVWQRAYQQREQEMGSDDMRRLEKTLTLRQLDLLWVDHLTAMDHLRDSVRLRAYGQRDPLVEYKREGYQMYHQLMDTFKSQVLNQILKAQFTKPQKPVFKGLQFNHPAPSATVAALAGQPQTQPAPQEGPGKASEKVGRNDPCPCGSGLKYKKCGMINAPEHKT